jgi:hypothetical protein
MESETAAQPKPPVRDVPHFPGPVTRLSRSFEVLDDVVRTADRALFESDEAMTRLDLIDRAVFVRGINLLKASRILLADGHWEVAASAARQLFELLVNAEYIAREPDRESAWFRYEKFGLLQLTQRILVSIEYSRSTGRPVDEGRARFATDLLQGGSFDEFRTKNGNWQRSWSGHTTKALAELSESDLRVKQYEQLFVAWSEETHAAPVALLHSMMPRLAEGWIEDQIKTDDREVGQMIMMLVSLFLQLCRHLPDSPLLDVEACLHWTNVLLREAAKDDSRPADEGLKNTAAPARATRRG